MMRVCSTQNSNHQNNMSITVKELKVELTNKKLSTKGNKAELVARLKAGNVTVAKKKAKAKKEKPVSEFVREVRQGCEVLTTGKHAKAFEGVLQFKPFKQGNSFVVRLPKQKEVIDALPHDADANRALKLLNYLRDSIKSMCGDASATWVLHASGSFGLYSTFNR